MKSYTVTLWAAVFGWLRWLSPFHWIRLRVPAGRRPPFTDSWVLGHLVLSIVALAALQASDFEWWEAILVGYGGLRILEVVVYQTNTLLFDQYRARRKGEEYRTVGPLRSTTLVITSYIEMVFWFALFYRNIPQAFDTQGLAINTFVESFRFSFHTMTTFSQSPITPRENIGNTVVFLQSVVGLFMALMIVVRLVAIVPRPARAEQPRRTDGSQRSEN